MWKLQVVWLMHMRLAFALVKIVFWCHVMCFKMEQRVVMKFCVKLKKTATEMFEMLKGA
jgi:hypothetical protein